MIDFASDTLVLIPARKGSKGIPHKNKKLLGGKPLIKYSIDIAKEIAPIENICISTDCEKIIDISRKSGLPIFFTRPKELSTDVASTYDVILHALDFFEKEKKRKFKNVLLLQPTSPFRLLAHIKACFKSYNNELDMVASFQKVKSNPFATFFTQKGGKLTKLFESNKGTRRQDAGEILELNGAIYLMNVKSLRRTKISDFSNIAPIIMDAISSTDIDEPDDWEFAQFILSKGKFKTDY